MYYLFWYIIERFGAHLFWFPFPRQQLCAVTPLLQTPVSLRNGDSSNTAGRKLSHNSSFGILEMQQCVVFCVPDGCFFSLLHLSLDNWRIVVNITNYECISNLLSGSAIFQDQLEVVVCVLLGKYSLGSSSTFFYIYAQK